MFDRTTHSLWNQFTGKPVLGPLTDKDIVLKQRPVVIDTWARWRSANPSTKVLSLNTGHNRDYGSGVVYNNYFNSQDLMFPAAVDQSTLAQKDYVFGIRHFGGAKAWPVKVFLDSPVINDVMLDQPIVLIGDAKTRTVRAFERDNLRFEGKATNLKSDDGNEWSVTEEALIGANGKNLPRIAGHISYWFAWNSYLTAKSELYEH